MRARHVFFMFMFRLHVLYTPVLNEHVLFGVTGGMQDWNYLHTNCFELTMEISCNKFPPEKELRHFWQANKYSLLVFMAQVRHR